jgi:transcriptional regulator with XRE-family HTH domain
VTPRDTSSSPSHPQETPLQRLGATLRQSRQQRRLSQRALAARTGIHHTYISEIELGQRNISVLTLLRLAHVLQMPAAGLLAPVDLRAPLVPPAACAHLPARAPQERAPQDYLPLTSPGNQARLLQLLGATLRQYREYQGLTKKVLAARTGLDNSYIGEIERGERNISVLNLVRLAEVLGLPVSQLLAPLERCLRPSLPLLE